MLVQKTTSSMSATQTLTRRLLEQVDELCAKDLLPFACVNEVYGVSVPESEGGTGQVVIVLACEPKPSMPRQPKLTPEFAFFEQFVGELGIMAAQESWQEEEGSNELWQKHRCPADAVGEIIDKRIRETRERLVCP